MTTFENLLLELPNKIATLALMVAHDEIELSTLVAKTQIEALSKPTIQNKAGELVFATAEHERKFVTETAVNTNPEIIALRKRIETARAELGAMRDTQTSLRVILGVANR